MAVLTPDIAKTELTIIELTNAFRAEQKLAAVKADPVLTAAARAYAKFLASSHMFSHTADGRQPQDRVKAAGYSYCRIAENLSLNMDSRGFVTAQLARDAVEGWKNSPGHRKNLVAPHVTEIGVGIAKSKTEEKYLSVQLFGRPMSLQYTFKIVNESGLPVRYNLNSEPHTMTPRMFVTHTECDPSEIKFEQALTKPTTSTDLQFPTRDGDTFTLRAAPTGVRVDVSSRPKAQ